MIVIAHFIGETVLITQTSKPLVKTFRMNPLSFNFN